MYQLLRAFTNMTRELDSLPLEIRNLPLRPLLGLHLERRLTHKQLVGQDTQTPLINRLGVVFLALPGLQHHDRNLRTQIVHRTADGRPEPRLAVDAVSEVGDLDLGVEAQQYVLGLDVAMHDVLAVHVAEGRGDLCDVSCGLLFGEAAFGLFVHFAVQAAARREFQDEVYALLVVEPGQQLEDVFVREVGVYLDLPSDERLFFFCGGLGFGDDLESANIARGKVTRKVDASEFAATQGTTELEIVRCEAGVRLGSGREGRRHGVAS
jgi:hypothetical protein